LVHHSSKVCVELRGQKPANFCQCFVSHVNYGDPYSQPSS
jgi:hypothetical protein